MTATYGFFVKDRLHFQSESLEEAERAARTYADTTREIVLVIKFSVISRIKPR